MNDGDVGEAVDHLDEIEEAQRKSRRGKGDVLIDSTQKSRQRVRERLNRIKHSTDVEE